MSNSTQAQLPRGIRRGRQNCWAAYNEQSYVCVSTISIVGDCDDGLSVGGSTRHCRIGLGVRLHWTRRAMHVYYFLVEHNKQVPRGKSRGANECPHLIRYIVSAICTQETLMVLCDGTIVIRVPDLRCGFLGAVLLDGRKHTFVVGITTSSSAGWRLSAVTQGEPARPSGRGTKLATPTGLRFR